MGSMLSSLNSDPLISIFVSFHLLVLLYAPCLFLRLLLSPVLICTGILLAGILRLGTTEKRKQLESTTPRQNHLESAIAREKHLESSTEKQELGESTTEKRKQLGTPKPAVEIEDGGCEKEERAEERELEKEEEREDGECEKEEREPEVVYRAERRFSGIFVEWQRRAPLEVIYEDSEGERDEDAGDRPERPASAREREETCSLSLCYPDSDSDSSSDDGFPVIDEWEYPENRYFRFEEEKDDGLIEIPIFLGGDRCRSRRSDGRGPGFFPVDEDNLIEIDLCHQTVVKRTDFPARIQAAT